MKFDELLSAIRNNGSDIEPYLFVNTFLDLCMQHFNQNFVTRS